MNLTAMIAEPAAFATPNPQDPMPREYRLAEMLCTRLCHDLIGPIGAVNNGAEFLKEEDGGLQGQVVELIETSARDAVARLQFFRLAYGRVNDGGEAGLSDLKKITEPFFRNSKVSLDWPDHYTDACGVPVSRRMGKLLLNMILIGSGALIRGGVLGVRIERRDEGDCLVVSASGKGARLDEETVAALSGKVDVAAVSARSVQPYVTLQIARALSAPIALESGEDRVELRVTRPLPQEG